MIATRPTDAATRPARQVGIVDDDPAVRESLRFLLDVSGYPATTRPTGVPLSRGDTAGRSESHSEAGSAPQNVSWRTGWRRARA